MLDITKVMAQVRAKITDTDLLKAVGADLSDIERGYINLQEAKSSVDTESKNRKLEIREDLKPKIDTMETEIAKLKKDNETLKNDTSSEALKTENTELKTFKETVLTDRRTSFVKSFSEIAKSEKFGKVVAEFKLPEHKTEDGKKFDYSTLKFDDMSEDDMNSNVTSLERLNRIEYFGVADPKVDAHGVRTSKVLPTSLQDQIDGAKTEEDLDKIEEQMNEEKA